MIEIVRERRAHSLWKAADWIANEQQTVRKTGSARLHAAQLRVDSVVRLMIQGALAQRLHPSLDLDLLGREGSSERADDSEPNLLALSLMRFVPLVHLARMRAAHGTSMAWVELAEVRAARRRRRDQAAPHCGT